MIGKAILGLLLLVIIYAIARANGIASDDFLGHLQTFLEWGADLAMGVWEFLTNLITNTFPTA